MRKLINSDHFYNKLALEREARFSLAEINQAVYDQQGANNEELNREFIHFKQWIAGKRFEHYLHHCKKPKSFNGKNQKEPCNSPHKVACICVWGLKTPDNSRTIFHFSFFFITATYLFTLYIYRNPLEYSCIPPYILIIPPLEFYDNTIEN